MTLYVCQPYLFWKGHYRIYFENLLGYKNAIYVYCNDDNLGYENSIYLKCRRFNHEGSFLGFMFSRLFHSLKLTWEVSQKFAPEDRIHFLEFEPLGIWLFLLLNRKNRKRVTVTVHSIHETKNDNKLKNICSKIQRNLFRYVLRILCYEKSDIIVHYEKHKDDLKKLNGCDQGNINVISYPTHGPRVDSCREVEGKRILIFGLIREDKGIFDFLTKLSLSFKYEITVAGKVLDNRVLSITHPKIKVIDRYFSEEKVKELFENHDFLLLPYPKDYAGGAGPMKDSLSYGVPVICQEIGIFEEVMVENDVGYFYKKVNDVESIIDQLSASEYAEKSKRCLEFSGMHNWDSMRSRYFQHFDKLMV